MAKISYEMFQKSLTEKSENRSTGNVKFFSLKNDGDEAIVRILCDSPEQYELLTAHTVKVGERWTKVECLNESARDTNCPLCNADVKMSTRLFIPMIQYNKDENGAIVPVAVMWDRSAHEMVPKLNGMLQEYGPLSDCVFKIRRNGKAGDMKTTYEILFANPNIYRPDMYPKDGASFEGFSVRGTMVWSKTAEELVEFLNTGSFPAKATNGESSPAINANNYAQNNTPPFDVESKPAMSAPTYNVPNTNGGRPTRYY